MHFKAVVMHNFMSYEKQVFEDLDEPALVLVEGRNLDEGGSNGAGKSSLWDAISWCLFGETMRGLKANQVILRGKKECAVTVHLLTKSGELMVTRTRGIVNSLYIETEDLKRIELGTLAQTQQWILDTLGIDFDLFRCTILFAQGDTFNFVDSGNKKQKEILARIMRVNYDEHLARAKLKASESASEITKTINEIRTLDSHLEVDVVEEYAERISGWISSRDHKVSGYKDKIKEKTLVLKTLGKPPGAFDSEELAAAKALVDKVKESHDRQVEKYSSRKALLNLKKRALVTWEETPEKCMACGQAVDTTKAKTMAKELRAEIEVVKVECEGLGDELEKTEIAHDKVKRKYDQIKESARALELYESKAGSIRDAIESLRLSVSEAQAEQNPYEAMRTEALAKQKKIEAKLKEKRAKLKELEDGHVYVQFWTNAFGDAGIKSFVFDLICSTLTNKANQYLNVLTNGSVSISFDTQKSLKSGETREKFDCHIVTDGSRVEYESYSGGEKRRISLAVDMALSDLMSDYYDSRFNIVVFDEALNYLDRQGRESFMRLVGDIAETKRVFIVDHDAEFKAKFDEVLTIEKKHGISRVV